MENKLLDDQGKCYDVTVQWYVTRSCNFSCPQCVGYSKKLKSTFAPEKINIPDLKDFLNKSDKIIKFVFSGGEPLCVENIVDAFSEITKKHYVGLVSNLVSHKVKEIADYIDHERVIFISATAHMLELEKQKLLDKFISNCLLLKSKGFLLETKEIAYPFIIEKIDDYKELFSNNGIELIFMPFRGVWKNKRYPEAYTKEEIKLFNLNKYAYFSTDIFKRKNTECCAGYNSVAVMNNGKVKPCFSIHKNIGNIYKKILYSKNLIKCPSNDCSNPFPVFEPYLFEKALREAKEKNYRTCKI